MYLYDGVGYPSAPATTPVISGAGTSPAPPSIHSAPGETGLISNNPNGSL